MQLAAARLRRSSSTPVDARVRPRYRPTGVRGPAPLACGAACSVCKPTAASPSARRAPRRLDGRPHASAPRSHRADGRDGRGEGPGGPCDVASISVTRQPAASASRPSSTCSNVATSHGRQRQGEGRRRSPHRREVTQVHGQGTMSNRIRRHEATISGPRPPARRWSGRRTFRAAA